MSCVTMVLALNRFTSPVQHFLLKCLTLHILWINVFCCVKFHKNLYYEEFRDILKFYKKGINYACTEDWTKCKQICYFLDVSEKVLSLIGFANDPYTL